MRLNLDQFIEFYREEPTDTPYVLAFRVPPQKPGEEPQYIRTSGSGTRFWEEEYVDSRAVEVIEPTPAAFHGVVEMTIEQLLALAVHAKLRGWDPLAEEAYRRAGRRSPNSSRTSR